MPIQPTKSITKVNEHDLQFYTWNNSTASAPAEGLCIVYHGFLAHGMYPTVRYAAELLAESGYIVVAADLPGHGGSSGDKGYLVSASDCIDFCVKIAKHVRNLHPNLPLFLVGSSMGGTLALAVAYENQEDNALNLAGVVLLAPMLKLSVSPIERTLLNGLAFIIPKLEVIPSSSTNAEKQYRDEAKRKECESDPCLSKSGRIRVGSAATCVNLVEHLKENFNKITCPVFVGVADEDVVVKPEGSIEFYEQCPSTDKTLKRYAALHGLLCEPQPLLDEIQNDILGWMNKRCQ